MSLDPDDITNVQRGIDAAIEAILEMAQVTSVHITSREGKTVAGPIIGFIQALTEHRDAVATKALKQALDEHPDIGDAEVTIEQEGTLQ